MAKFRRKPVEVDAVQFVDGRYGEAIDFCPVLVVEFEINASATPGTRTRTVTKANCNNARVDNTDWLLKNSDGTFTVINHADFVNEYEAAQ